MRQYPLIAWTGRSDFIPPDLSGIAKQNPQGQLMVTPERISKAESGRLFADLLADLGKGKW